MTEIDLDQTFPCAAMEVDSLPILLSASFLLATSASSNLDWISFRAVLFDSCT